MKLETQDIVSTLGIAGSYASGLAQFFRYGSEVKRIHAGKSSESGTMAALMTQAGIDGPPHILEGDFGFCRAYSDGYRPEVITENLGKEFKIMEITIRPNACSARLQASVEAAFNVTSNDTLPLSKIREITIGIPRIIAGRLTHEDPPDLQSAQLSLPFSVALAFYLGVRKSRNNPYLSVQDYEVNIRNPEVRALATRIVCAVDENIDKNTTSLHVPSRLEIKLVGRKKIVHEVQVPKGSPKNPLTREELKERFKNQVGPILGAKKVHAIFDKIDDLNNLPVVSVITKLVKLG